MNTNHYHLPLSSGQQHHQPGYYPRHSPSTNIPGPYGRDGAPSFKLLTSIPAAATSYEPSSGSPRTQGSYPLSLPKQDIRSSQPRNHVPQRVDFPRPLNTHGQSPHSPSTLSPPRAVFVEPQSPTKLVMSGNSERLTGRDQFLDPQQQSLKLTNESILTPTDEKNFIRNICRDNSSEWLRKQRAKRHRLKIFMGILIVILIVIAAAVIGHFSRQNTANHVTSPQSFTWANGGSGKSIPSFANSTLNVSHGQQTNNATTTAASS